MKKLIIKTKADRKRGLSDIWATLLGIIVGLGILASVMVVYKQAQNSSTLTAKTQQLMSISTEVESMFNTQPSYGTTGADLTNTVKGASSLPDSSFSGVAIAVDATDNTVFDITMSNLPAKTCQRIALSDLGVNATADASDCANGNLTVAYAR